MHFFYKPAECFVALMQKHQGHGKMKNTFRDADYCNNSKCGCGLFNHMPGTNTEKYQQHKHLTTNRTTRPFLPHTDVSPHQAGSQGLRSAENSRAKTVHELTPCWSKNTLSPRRPLGKAVSSCVTILILQFIL